MEIRFARKEITSAPSLVKHPPTGEFDPDPSFLSGLGLQKNYFVKKMNFSAALNPILIVRGVLKSRGAMDRLQNHLIFCF